MSLFDRLPARLRRPAQLEWRKLRSGGYFALNDLDRKLEKYLDKRDGFFVELGANDGQTQSNTLYFELKKGWRGVLIEPIPHRFVECLRLRGERSAVFCAACVPLDYAEPWVPMRYADLMTTSDTLTTLRDQGEHMTKAAGHFDSAESYEFAARARTITAILDEAQAPAEIDLLSLDVEGAELSVLQGLDTQKYSFRCMLIETADIAAVEAALPGYHVIDTFSAHDYLLAPDTAARESLG